MGFKKLAEVRAYQATRALKLEIYRLVKAHPEAYNDLRFRGQMFEAAASAESNIAEGFRRFSAGEFAHFLRIARGSIEEVATRVQDGIDREYFAIEACKAAAQLADEAGKLTTALITSLQPFIRSRSSRAKPQTPPNLGRRPKRPPGPEP